MGNKQPGDDRNDPIFLSGFLGWGDVRIREKLFLDLLSLCLYSFSYCVYTVWEDQDQDLVLEGKEGKGMENIEEKGKGPGPGPREKLKKKIPYEFSWDFFSKWTCGFP